MLEKNTNWKCHSLLKLFHTSITGIQFYIALPSSGAWAPNDFCWTENDFYWLIKSHFGWNPNFNNIFRIDIPKRSILWKILPKRNLGFHSISTIIFTSFMLTLTQRISQFPYHFFIVLGAFLNLAHSRQWQRGWIWVGRKSNRNVCEKGVNL